MGLLNCKLVSGLAFQGVLFPDFRLNLIKSQQIWCDLDVAIVQSELVQAARKPARAFEDSQMPLVNKQSSRVRCCTRIDPSGRHMSCSTLRRTQELRHHRQCSTIGLARLFLQSAISSVCFLFSNFGRAPNPTFVAGLIRHAAAASTLVGAVALPSARFLRGLSSSLSGRLHSTIAVPMSCFIIGAVAIAVPEDNHSALVALGSSPSEWTNK